MRDHLEVLGVFFELEVLAHDVEDVEELPLIGVETLDLDVEDRIGVDLDAIGGFDEGSEGFLVGRLHLHELA